MASDATDRIGDRLDHPELVPPELRHLIPDDQQRVKRILEFRPDTPWLDLGSSDGAVFTHIKETWGHLYGPSLYGPSNVGVDLNGSGDVLRDDALGYLAACEPKRFYTIYACEFLEHLTPDDGEFVVREAARVSGDLIVTVPNRVPDERYVRENRARWDWPDHRSQYKGYQLESLLRRWFKHIQWVPLYDGETPDESIFLIARARGRR